LKELIPEFYEEDPDFLLNLQDLDFGITCKGEKISHVKLPAWASDAVDYLRKMKEALESDYVSCQLHNWIDLIFGYKQRGQAALDADNCKSYFIILVFHPLTYDGNTDITRVQDIVAKKAIEIQVNEYGQTPKQLFKKPHPKRFSNKISIMLKEEKVAEIMNEPIDGGVGVAEEVAKIEIYESDKIIEAYYNFNRTFTQIPKYHKK
jgi:factor associated with neutral sphingomyelinase activation